MFKTSSLRRALRLTKVNTHCLCELHLSVSSETGAEDAQEAVIRFNSKDNEEQIPALLKSSGMNSTNIRTILRISI